MPKSISSADTDFLKLARERFSSAMQADAEDREMASSDVLFASGQQWSEDARKARIDASRPVLTWSHMTGFIAQVVNDGRQNKPSVKVSAMDGGSKATAEFFQSRIRHIEYESDADIAYDTARESQVMCGRGFFRVTTEYLPKSFEQTIKIKRIENQFSVMFDPAAREYDRSDADWCFIISRISKDEFKRTYGADTEAVASNWYNDTDNPAPEWIGVGPSQEMIQIAEYWVKEYRKRTLIELAPGQSVWKDELPKGRRIPASANQREVDDCTVCQYVINGVEILDKTEWLSKYIPVIPQWGKEITVEGKRQTVSLIRPAKDAQRLVNLYVSNIAEQIAMMPKTPWIAAEGQISGHEQEWEEANTVPRAVLLYKQTGVAGQPAPPPHREINEPPIQALSEGLKQAIDAMKAACNIYDSSLGNRSNETSGVAIQKRQKESDVANFHFSDNESRSRKLLGRILLELIPKIDKGERTVGTRAEDGKTKTVRVNTPQPYPDEETGEPVHHMLDQGSYSVAISTGPSYTSQRAEAYDIYSQLANADPDLLKVAGDLIIRNLDAPGSDQIADRLEKTLPPNLQPQNNQQQQIPPQVQAQISQLSQQLQQAHAFAQSLHEQIQTDQVKMQAQLQMKQLEIESRERIENIKAQVSLIDTDVTAKSGNAQALLMGELASIKHRLDLQDAANQRGHEMQMAQQSQAAQAQGQQADQQHEADQQAQAAQQQPKAA